MNTQRVIVLGIALVAAGAAAFMVRSLIGGGTPQVAGAPRAAHRDERSAGGVNSRCSPARSSPPDHGALGKVAQRPSIPASLPTPPSAASTKR